METKRIDIPFEIKEVSDEGTFEGFASVYGVIDEGGDVVEKGAFARTLNARPEVPILWRHDSPIGKGTLEDSERGLIIKGRLTMAVSQAREALALAKDGVVKGLSIGFITVKEEVKQGIRYLKEVRLMEVSLTPFPMNPAAQVTAVKEEDLESKAGRMMSAATRAKIQAIMADHQALMNKLQALVDEADAGTSGKELEPVVPDPRPADPNSDPAANHSEELCATADNILALLQ
jgi:HK97 family phage prohead protease